MRENDILQKWLKIAESKDMTMQELFSVKIGQEDNVACNRIEDGPNCSSV